MKLTNYIILLVILTFALGGCHSAPPRLTTETVMLGEIVVEWPIGTSAADVITVESGGRVQTVAPAPIPTPAP